MEDQVATVEIFLAGVIFILGVIASVVYYFARYYFKTDESDKEVVSRPLIDLDKKKVSETRDLKSALHNTQNSLLGRIQGLFSGGKTLSDQDLESLEEILYTSDLGPQTVQRLVSSVGEKLHSSEKADFPKVREALRAEMRSIFTSVGVEKSFDEIVQGAQASTRPQVWMIVGVNGAGKTTTIGKLAHLLAAKGLKVLVAAGDTFRAAAGNQLKVWSERAQVEIFHQENVKDPSAIAYAACERAKSGEFDIVIIDTAGRLHTQANLMEELKKMKRVVGKLIPQAPHETLLVLDANNGQNALVQAKAFNEALEVSGVILTKMDGTAKGGVAVGLACELKLPVRLLGIGEGLEDLRSFRSTEFVDSIL